MKQIITWLIVCVGVLMLAFIVAPHHHHNGLPCFSVEEFLDHHHHESDAGDEETCALDQLEFVTVFNQRVANICAICLHSHAYLLQAVLFGFNDDFSLPEEIWDFRQPPYLVNYHSIFANQTLGLRAPPMA